ncbi:MAG: hypothetical protein WCV84_01720 [Patescibacteria group bacterium]
MKPNSLILTVCIATLFCGTGCASGRIRALETQIASQQALLERHTQRIYQIQYLHGEDAGDIADAIEVLQRRISDLRRLTTSITMRHNYVIESHENRVSSLERAQEAQRLSTPINRTRRSNTTAVTIH